MKQNQGWNIEGLNGNTPIRDLASPLSSLISVKLRCVLEDPEAEHTSLGVFTVCFTQCEKERKTGN